MTQFRTGIGTDQHAFEPEGSSKPLVLGGVRIPGARGLKAHSDGDVLLHALFNAISSACGGRSIGHYHSDKDEAKRGTASTEYMATARKMLQEHGLRVNNASIAMECAAPKIEPYAETIKASLAKILDCQPEHIGITANTGEGLTAYGKGEGIYVQAVVSLTQ